LQREKTGIGDRWKTRSHGDDLNQCDCKTEAELETWWKLKMPMWIVKRKTGIGDRWETRSQDD
jgi:hypothetical protein